MSDKQRYFRRNVRPLNASVIAMVLAAGVFTQNVHANAELVYLDTFSGNNNNPAGMATLSLALGLSEEESLKDYVIAELGSTGGTDNGFTVTPTNFKGDSEAIAGEWWFDPAASGFDTIDYLVVKAGNQYSLYDVDYLPGVTEGDSVHGSWSTYGLGQQAMSHITAYSVPFLNTPIPGTAVLFGSAIIGLGIGVARKRKTES